MTASDSLHDILACPRCDKSPLTLSDAAYRCKACKTEFPSLDGIPWLFAEPQATLGEWRNRLHFALQQLSGDAQRLAAELQGDALLPLTRQRLEAQKTAAEEHRKKLREILAPLDIQSMQGSFESFLALRTRLPIEQGIHTYYANIHRDWAWGDEENRASLEQIRNTVAGQVAAGVANDSKASPGNRLGDTLVLGAGACRLAYDMHMQMDTARTVAMDFNPLLLLIAKRVMKGQEAQLYEFPLAPLSQDDFAVKRTLSAPEPVRDGFSFLFGDALRPPIAPGSLDTVVTPWLIDIVNDDLPNQAARINTLLKPGGRWINFGSLAFEHPLRARRYGAPETLAIVENSGFGAPFPVENTIPYMCSPASRHARSEKVFSFAAVKAETVNAPPRHKALPDWIVTGKVAVPLLQSFQKQAVATRVHAFIMALIDGKRTLGDMALVMEQQKLMTRAEAEPAIRTFLTRMYDDSERNSGF